MCVRVCVSLRMYQNHVLISKSYFSPILSAHSWKHGNFNQWTDEQILDQPVLKDVPDFNLQIIIMLCSGTFDFNYILGRDFTY